LARIPKLDLALKYAPFYLKGFYEYHIKKHFGPLAPRELMFPITYRCNARCIMCNIWQLPKKKELSLQQIEQLASNKLFKGIQAINLTGGEPTLRKDIIQIAYVLTDLLPKLEKLTLTTNALDTEKVTSSCIGIAESCRKHGIDFLVEASLDGIGKTHDNIRNVPDAFGKVTETTSELKQLSKRHHFRLGINTTISPFNLHDASRVYEWCKEHNIDTFFTVASIAENYYANIGDSDSLQFQDEDKKYLVAFLQKLAEEKSAFNFLAYYYNDLIKMIRDNQPRTTPCVFRLDAFILDAFGDMYYCLYGNKIGNCLERNCSEIYFDPQNLAHRQEIIRDKCPTCFTNCFSSIGIGKELFKYLRFLFSN